MPSCLFGVVALMSASCGAFSGASSEGAPEPPKVSPECDPNETPGAGVFVSASIGLAGGLGTQAIPLKTIREGLEAAAAKGVNRVFVDEGSYPEKLEFTDRHAGIIVSGGWKGAETSWRRECESGARAKTILASPESVAVSVTATISAPTSGLESLTLSSTALGAAPADTSGTSSIGVLVQGPASFRLRFVKVVATRGGMGGVASPKPAQTGTVACTGVGATCTNGSAGSTLAAGAQASPGIFAANGFRPGDGAPGAVGTPGANGTPGTTPRSQSCAIDVSGQCMTDNGDCLAVNAIVAANPGSCGCGGQGGEGGRPGRGGGASIGILVVGTGTVAVESASITAVGGGDGSAGGAGAEGAAGGVGRDGGPVKCLTEALGDGPNGPNCRCVLKVDLPIAGGTPGGRGGGGGAGSIGGGGAGGPAYGFVVVGGGKVLEDAATVFSVGPGGAGAGEAPGGASAKSLFVEAPADGG